MVPSRPQPRGSPSQAAQCNWGEKSYCSFTWSYGRNLLLVSKLGFSFQIKPRLVKLQELQRDRLRVQGESRIGI